MLININPKYAVSNHGRIITIKDKAEVKQYGD